MLTCVIHYEIDPNKKAQFEHYTRNWGTAIPRCGADLIGYYAPHEGSSTLAYGIYNIPRWQNMRPTTPVSPPIPLDVKTMVLRNLKNSSCAKIEPF